MSDGATPQIIPFQPISVPEKQKVETLEEVIGQKAPEVLKAIPVEQREKLARVTFEQHQFSMRAGPLPDPAELAAYNNIIPNGAERILKMAENQSAHRIEIEKIVVVSQQRQGFYGQFFALIIGLVGLGLATFAAIEGQPWFGSIIGGTTLVSLVSAFLYSRHLQKKELNVKKPQVLPPQMVPQTQSNRKKKQGRR